MRKITFHVALLLLGAAAASAQTASWMRVTVPFSFVAANTNCPAGDYTVNIDHSTGLVRLDSQAKSAALITSTDPRPADRDRAYLRFRHYGEHWVLQEIVARGTAQQLNPSKLEEEYAKAKPAEDKIVAATVNK
jgi:hypothetical protein